MVMLIHIILGHGEKDGVGLTQHQGLQLL